MVVVDHASNAPGFVDLVNAFRMACNAAMEEEGYDREVVASAIVAAAAAFCAFHLSDGFRDNVLEREIDEACELFRKRLKQLAASARQAP